MAGNLFQKLLQLHSHSLFEKLVFILEYIITIQQQILRNWVHILVWILAAWETTTGTTPKTGQRGQIAMYDTIFFFLFQAKSFLDDGCHPATKAS